MKSINEQKISPTIWMDGQTDDAAKFYATVFPNAKINRSTLYGKEGNEIHGQKEGTIMTIDFEIEGYRFTLLNGGPVFKPNPSISFFATYDDESIVNKLWEKLSEGAKILMPFEKYPWSEKYGWLEDRFGVSWQIALSNRKDVDGQAIIPSLMFVNEQYGRAEEAMTFYTSVFNNSKVNGALYYEANELPDKEGAIKHAQFSLGDQTFMVMDSAMDHSFTFSEGVSLVVNCRTQEEIDYYWDTLSEGGDPKAMVCGWLKDKFGVSWQIVPIVLEEMLQDKDKVKTERVTKAFMAMKKMNIKELEKAFRGH